VRHKYCWQGVTAACGEEIFFRGFLEQWLGLNCRLTVVYGCSFFGSKDMRGGELLVNISGLVPRFFLAYAKNLIVPKIAHGRFDMGGMVYFRGFMVRLQNKRI
jgi:hypothetical protein